MTVFDMPVQVRWSDLDPNFHFRHSVYYDWGAMCRMEFLVKHGLTTSLMQQLQFGPIILREEAIFRREIKYGDPVIINLQLAKGRRDYSRWTITHEIKKDDLVCARLTIDGAWLNTKERKMFLPPAKAVEVFQQMPVGNNFEWLD